jgi:hypothetical protein
MMLPDITLLALYAHLAWGLVLGAAGVGLIWRVKPFHLRFAAFWLLVAFVACQLPGRASPAFWMGLACQAPSAFLLSLCVLAVWNRGAARPEERVLPTGLAIGIVIAGAVLYADTWGWLYLGLYVRGFGPEAAVAGLLVGAAAVVAVTAGLPRRPALSAIAAIVIFSVWRLPTGNVWDALLDPILWWWALLSLMARVASRCRPRRVPPPASTTAAA